jgi:hypothetical protein
MNAQREILAHLEVLAWFGCLWHLQASRLQHCDPTGVVECCQVQPPASCALVLTLLQEFDVDFSRTVREEFLSVYGEQVKVRGSPKARCWCVSRGERTWHSRVARHSSIPVSK